MPLVFPVVLLLILGAVTLASRSTSSFLAASKQSDAQAAKEAATSGISLVLSRLNPIGKGSTDAYLSFLLASKWDNGGWTITKAANIADVLQDCRIATRGRISTQTLPSTGLYAQLMSNVVGTAANGQRTLRYRVVNYSPPDNPQSLPNTCDSTYISSVSGGQAQITVEGTVELNGRQLASHTLTRNFDIQASPLVENNASVLPGPPISLRIEQKGTAMGGITPLINAAAGYTQINLVPGVSMRPQCSDCSPTPVGGISNYFPRDGNGEPTDLPLFPEPPANPPVTPIVGPTTIDSRCFDSSGNIIQTPACTTPPPPPCSLSDGVLNCKIQSIQKNSSAGSPNAVLTVDTGAYPVNLYLEGDAGTPTSFVEIIHQINGQPFDENGNNKNLWHRLRIFGKIDAAKKRVCNGPTQNLYISSANKSLNGVFLWLPNGNLTYGAPGNSNPASLQTNWWVCNLDLRNLTSRTNFIMPLYGIPEPVNAILGNQAYPILFTPRTTF